MTAVLAADDELGTARLTIAVVPRIVRMALQAMHTPTPSALDALASAGIVRKPRTSRAAALCVARYEPDDNALVRLLSTLGVGFIWLPSPTSTLRGLRVVAGARFIVRLPPVRDNRRARTNARMCWWQSVRSRHHSSRQRMIAATSSQSQDIRHAADASETASPLSCHHAAGHISAPQAATTDRPTSSRHASQKKLRAPDRRYTSLVTTDAAVAHSALSRAKPHPGLPWSSPEQSDEGGVRQKPGTPSIVSSLGSNPTFSIF